MALISKPPEISSSPLEQLHNYFENLVIEALRARAVALDEDIFVDVACVALNDLPAKYIRHDVDMAYFTDPGEMAIIRARVERAIDSALERVLGATGAPGA